jgi:hypothetical protein
MTLNDCKEALKLEDDLKKYRSFLKEHAGRNLIDTCVLDTGRGQEKLSIAIPYSYVEGIIQKRVFDIEATLEDMGVTDA